MERSRGNRGKIREKCFIPVKMSLSEISLKKDKTQYPCMCQASNSVLFLGRIYGLLPVVRVDKDKFHHNGCPLKVSNKWFSYSVILEIVYFVFFLFGYGTRLIHGPMEIDENNSEWYVMTIGYMVSDLDALISILLGMILVKKVCPLFEEISRLPGSVGEMRILQQRINTLLQVSISVYLVVLTSYLYVGYFRFTCVEIEEISRYDILEMWFSCVIRGLTVWIPMVQLIIVFMFACIIWLKFESLAVTTEKSINKLSQLYLSPYQRMSKPNITEDVCFKVCMLSHLSAMDITEELEQLSRAHQEISDVLTKVNDCFGIQILFTVSANLYTLIYYLFRYSTASNYGFSSNHNEKVHYMIGLSYRMIKMFIYMLIGKFIHDKSLQPLRVMQSSKLINLPTQVQQQVQTLLLQWNGKSGYLSAFGVINIGPWLLAPIVGNVITYLLVALQFNVEDINN